MRYILLYTITKPLIFLISILVCLLFMLSSLIVLFWDYKNEEAKEIFFESIKMWTYYEELKNYLLK